MTPRLHVNVDLTEGATAALNDQHAHYLRNVLRRGEGDGLLLFNSHDGEFAATITALGKKGGQALVGARTRAPVEEPDLWLLFAPLKRGPVDMIAQKATELGVAVLQPVETARTNAGRVNIERLAAIATEAAEQCERLSVPELRVPAKLGTLLENWPESRALIFCDEAGDDENAAWGGPSGRAAPILEALSSPRGDKAAILIGPEGGFSPEERADLRSRKFIIPVTLGPRILRADTAAIAAVTLWQAARGDLRRR